MHKVPYQLLQHCSMTRPQSLSSLNFYELLHLFLSPGSSTSNQNLIKLFSLILTQKTTNLSHPHPHTYLRPTDSHFNPLDAHIFNNLSTHVCWTINIRKRPKMLMVLFLVWVFGCRCVAFTASLDWPGHSRRGLLFFAMGEAEGPCPINFPRKLDIWWFRNWEGTFLVVLIGFCFFS